MTQTPYAFSPRSTIVIALLVLIASTFTVVAGNTNTLKGALDTNFYVGANAVVTGDFNGDGKLDCAVSNSTLRNVGVAFGKGDGGLLPPAFYSLVDQPAQVITGQFSNDSFLDLVALTSGGAKLLTNNGAGGFTVNTYNTVFVANNVAAGDLNNDGRTDLVVTGSNTGLIGVLLASPIGGFETPVLIDAPNSNITSVALGLMNADNNLDLVVTNSGLNRIAIMTGNGTGGFSAPVTFTTGTSSQPSRLTLGDLNGDLKLDVMAIVQGATKVVFLAGDGLGAVAAPVLITPASADNFSYIFLQDVNADTKLDILLAGYTGNTLCLMYGNGTGGVSAEKVFMLTKGPRAVAAGDFNGDGLIDLPAVSESTGAITMLLNQGAGDFLTPKFVTSTVAPPYFADFNLDGKQDLILDTSAAGVRGVRFGNGDGTFQAPAAFPGFFRGTDFIIGYVNSDNFPDIVASGSGGLSVLLNNGSGGFPAAIDISTAVGKLGLGDFDADGKIDLVMGQNSSFSPNLRIYKGDGLGNFALVAGDTVGTGIGSLTVADFNGDGKPDLHLSMSGGGVTAVKLLTSANTFGPAQSITNDTCNPRSATPIAVDFNHDGKLDIASSSTCFNGSNFAIFVGDGAGNFTLWGNFASPGGGAQIADFNRDGNLDIGTIGQGEYGVAYGNGAGQFTVSTYAAGGSLGPAAVADITSDGVPDVIFQGAINIPGMYALFSRPQSRGQVTADFDGDGKTDLSVFRPSSGTWYILRSSDNTFYGVQFGQNGDRPVPGDYDGDGKTDLAVFRNGDWYLLRSSNGGFVQQHHGSPGDIPVPSDYNGDGITNFAVFRPSTGYWYTSTDPLINYGAVQWGANGDIPTPADYDGDGRADVSVFRPSGGSWYLLQSSAGFFQIQHGVNGDKPVPVDYDGDGRANIAVFRPANGTWYRSTNPATNYGAIQWGAGSDVLVPGYYDGDNQADVAIFRDGTWYIFYSSTQSYSFFNFGSTGDIPIPSAFVP